jgi:hypothetical protein
MYPRILTVYGVRHTEFGDASGNLAPVSSCGPGLPTLPWASEPGNPTSGEHFYPYHETAEY